MSYDNSMLCPQCLQPLTEKEVVTSNKQKTTIYECFNCGGHFVPPLVTNLIIGTTAQDLDSITPPNTYPTNPTVICPVCQQTMISITDDVIPKNVTVYACPENHGNYFPIHQLSAFKKAQRTKLEYHQLWGIPIKSVFTILLPIIAIFTAIATIPFTIEQLKLSQENRIKADSLISTPLISTISSVQVIVSFTTKTPLFITLQLSLPDGSQQDFPTSTSAETNHLVNLEGLQPKTLYRYNLIVDGKTFGPYSFTTP